MKKALEAKAILLHILAVENKPFISVARFQRLLVYIYNELVLRKLLGKFDVIFDVDVDSIERVVLYNIADFDMDLDREIIYLRRKKGKESATKVELDTTLVEIINDFMRQNPVC